MQFEWLEDRRLLSAGGLDPAFGGVRSVAFNIYSSTDADATAVAVQTNGKIVVVGTVKSGTTPSAGDFGVARLNSDGTPDTTFGSGGQETLSFSNFGGTLAFASAVAIQPDGKLLIAGQVYVGTNDADEVGVVRLNSNGTLDTTFGTGGEQCFFYNSPAASIENDEVAGLAVQPDGKVLVAGTSFGELNNDGYDNFAVARLNANGTLDSTFASGGRELVSLLSNGTTMVGESFLNGIALQSDGKILLAGSTPRPMPGAYNFGTAIAAVRLNSDGSLDSSFGTNGVATVSLEALGSNATAYGITELPGGEVLPAGTDTTYPPITPFTTPCRFHPHRHGRAD